MANFMNRYSTLTALTLSATFVGNAFAGDFAALNILGFSDDGAVFAFEEYGVQDGSGFPYANRFYIDTSTDQFISGSPIRVRIDDETADVAQARSTAAAQGQSIIADTALNAGYLAGFNAITEASADPARMSVNPRPVVPPIDAPIEFRLTEKQFAPSGSCDGIQDVSIGFTLTQIGIAPGQEARTLHDDASVPSSRNCPLGYRLGGVHTYYPEAGQPVYAVTIAVQSFGFEGPDYRWMAVTTNAAPDTEN